VLLHDCEIFYSRTISAPQTYKNKSTLSMPEHRHTAASRKPHPATPAYQKRLIKKSTIRIVAITRRLAG